MSEPSQSPIHPAPAPDYDEIPVEDLIRLTREFTRRITNQDRQRLGLELRESGHARTIQLSAPVTLQQFFSGEIDLDADLARRFQNAPLLSHVHMMPRLGEPVRRQATATFTSNDETASLTVDALINPESTVEFTFTLFSALALRFHLAPLSGSDRSRWLDLMRRENGITFLWTHARWEEPHLIFVVREFFGRVYAFSPTGIEAAARMTPDMITALVDWLDGLWFPGRYAAARSKPEMSPEQANERPTQGQRPRLSARTAIPDAPEEQWEESPAAPTYSDAEPLPPVDDGEGNSLSGEDLEW